MEIHGVGGSTMKPFEMENLGDGGSNWKNPLWGDGYFLELHIIIP